MTPEARSELYKIAAVLIRNQFDDIVDLDLPKNFGKRRWRRLSKKINDYNEFIKKIAIRLKDFGIKY